MIRVGIIGMGFMGYTHFRIYEKHPGAKVVALCDSQQRRLDGDWSDIGGNLGDLTRGCQDLSGVFTTTDPHQLISEPQVDLVDICVRTDLHCDLAQAALQAGKHVLLEKPMALNTEQCGQIVLAAQQASGQFMVGHCIRFWPQYAWVREAVASGRYGKVREIFLRRIASPPTYGYQNWLMNERISGGALLDLQVHDIDYLLYLMGWPKSVLAWGERGPSGGVDVVHAGFEFRGGAHATVIGGWAYHLPWRMELLVRFEHATIVYETSSGQPLTVWLPGGKSETPKVNPGDGYEREIDYFLKCIERNERPTVSSAKSAAETIALLEAERQSIEQGEVVELDSGGGPDE